MSNFISHFRLPNYEDYDWIGPSRHYLKHWPEMWDAELYADKVVRPMQFFPMSSPVMWHKRHMPMDIEGKAEQRTKVYKALAQMAQANGFKVKNAEDVVWFGVSKIYKTLYVKPERQPKLPLWMKKPVDDSLKIDNAQLVRMMGRDIPVSVTVLTDSVGEQPIIHGVAIDRDTLVHLALESLAKDNKYEIFHCPMLDREHKPFYKIR